RLRGPESGRGNCQTQEYWDGQDIRTVRGPSLAEFESLFRISRRYCRFCWLLRQRGPRGASRGWWGRGRPWRPVALLIFLAAPAGAGIVASDLLATDDLLGLFRDPAAHHLHFGLLAPFAPLVLADHFLLFFRSLHKEEIAQGFVLDPIHQTFEHIKGLALIFHQWVALAVATQADAFLQVVHGQKVVFPLRVHYLQHDHALVEAHAIGAPDLLALRVLFAGQASQFLGELVEGLGFKLLQVELAKIDSQPVPELRAKAIDIPLVGVLRFGAEFGDQPIHHAVASFQDEFLLLMSFEQLTAQTVNGLALLVHHIVVLEQVLAGLEILRFHGLLRGLDALADHSRLDVGAFFHAQPLHEAGDPILGEDAHQVVLE